MGVNITTVGIVVAVAAAFLFLIVMYVVYRRWASMDERPSREGKRERYDEEELRTLERKRKGIPNDFGHKYSISDRQHYTL